MMDGHLEGLDGESVGTRMTIWSLTELTSVQSDCTTGAGGEKGVGKESV